jgi:hypothetical protein
MVDTKSAWVEYPGLRGFEVEIANLSRPELIKLRKGCMFTKMDRKTRQPVEELDEEKFVEKFTGATVKNWKGFKVKHLETLLLADISGQDPEKDIPFTIEDARDLVSNSAEFDTWLNEAVFDLENFRSERDTAAVDSPGPVAAKQSK